MGIIRNKIRFMFAGNCTFIIETDFVRFAYKIFRKDNSIDNNKIYQLYIKKENKNIYCGYFKIRGNVLTYKHNDKYGINETDIQIQTLLDAIRNRNSDEYRIMHTGRCAHCGRQLIDETSIEVGFGPKCYKKLFEREHEYDKATTN